MTKTLEKRWSFRVSPDADRVVREAASISHRNLTEFVQQAALMEASRILADRSRFILSQAEWKRFVELLDRSPRENPGLERLFAKPDVFA